jgi:hypothetical protein
VALVRLKLSAKVRCAGTNQIKGAIQMFQRIATSAQRLAEKGGILREDRSPHADLLGAAGFRSFTRQPLREH